PIENDLNLEGRFRSGDRMHPAKHEPLRRGRDARERRSARGEEFPRGFLELSDRLFDPRVGLLGLFVFRIAASKQQDPAVEVLLLGVPTRLEALSNARPRSERAQKREDARGGLVQTLTGIGFRLHDSSLTETERALSKTGASTNKPPAGTPK